MSYKVILNAELIAKTDWPPLAQAAWNRAARDRDSAQHGGTAELWFENELLARVQPETKIGHPWPDRQAPEPDLRDILKSVLLLARNVGLNTKEVAEAMTRRGLPTTRSRVDALRGSTQGKRTEVTEAELLVMLDGMIDATRE